MKTAIVYFSHTGNNALLAQKISSEMGADLFRITEPKKRSMFKIMLDIALNRTPRINDLKIDWSKYDFVVLLSPIWTGRIAHPMKSFIKKSRGKLVNYAFLSLCVGEKDQARHIQEHLKTLTGHAPRKVTNFSVRNLVPPEHRDDDVYISKFKIDEKQLEKLDGQIEDFIGSIQPEETIMAV
jgi:flavodoxin